MPVVILFGTETGTAEFVAYDLADELQAHQQSEVCDMAEYDLDTLSGDNFYIFVCSTHEDGALPESAQPFYDRLISTSPSLAGVRYAMFGMGDSTYADTFNFGSVTIDAKITDLGATRVGQLGSHDASSRDSASDAAVAWLQGILLMID